MEFLLRYNNNDTNELITAAEPEETINELLKYLNKAGIALVDSIPEKVGLFCVNEKVAYRVYQSVFNKEDNTFECHLIYSLQWLPWGEKQAKCLEDYEKEKAAKLAEDAELPVEPPALTRS